MADSSRLLDLAITRAIKAWGGSPAWQRIGMHVRLAAVAEQLLVVLASQDESMSGDTFRDLFNELYSRFNDLTGDYLQ